MKKYIMIAFMLLLSTNLMATDFDLSSEYIKAQMWDELTVILKSKNRKPNDKVDFFVCITVADRIRAQIEVIKIIERLNKDNER